MLGVEDLIIDRLRAWIHGTSEEDGRWARRLWDGLLRREVERMVKDAEAHAADDQTRRDAIDARNQADALIYQVEKTLTESKDKLGAAEAGRVEAALAAARQAVKSDDVTSIRNATSELQQASHAMAQALYQASASGAQASGSDVKEGEVVDAA